MKRILKYVVLGSVLALPAFMAGCSGTDKVELQVASATGTITGKLVDASTMEPVSGATVSVIYNGKKVTTTSSASTDADIKGTFVVSGLPATDLVLKIEKSETTTTGGVTTTTSTYATVMQQVTIPQTNDNSPVSKNVGQIALAKGFDLKVLVTDDAGAAKAGVSVYADGNDEAAWSQITAVSAADGTATLKGLNQLKTYDIIAAPTYDAATGFVATTTSTVAYNFINNDRSVLPVTVGTARRDDAIIVTPVGALANNAAALNLNAHLRGSTPKFVFNYPVADTGSIKVTYTNNLIAFVATDTAFNKLTTVTTASATLDASKVIMAISNTEKWAVNQTYRLQGSVTATVNGVVVNKDISQQFYIADDTTAGLSATTTLTADNYDGLVGTGASVLATGVAYPVLAAAGQVYINFPEAIYGTYRILSTTVKPTYAATTTTTNLNNGAIDFIQGPVTTTTPAGTPSSGAVYGTNGSATTAGSAAAVVYRYPLFNSTTYTPATTTAPASYTAIAFTQISNDVNLSPAIATPTVAGATVSSFDVYIDVTDAEGNRFSKTVTLKVK